MGLCGMRKRVFTSDVDVQRAGSDPIEQSLRMRTEKLRRVDVIEEDRVTDLDAPR